MTKITPITILLAEDNPDHAELMIDTFEGFQIGNAIIHVRNGEEVLDYLSSVEQGRAVSPNLILLDLKMPRMDGATTLMHIRERPRFRSVPVVMISTSTAECDINHCYELGANSYISKPLQFEELTRKIRELNLYWVLTSELPRKE